MEWWIFNYPNVAGLDIGYTMLFLFIGMFVASIGVYKAFKPKTMAWWLSGLSAWALGITSLAMAFYVLVSGLQMGWANVEAGDIVLSLIIVVAIVVEALGLEFGNCGCKGE